MKNYLLIILIIIIIIILLGLLLSFKYLENYQDKDNKFYLSSMNINDFQDIISMRDSSESQHSEK
jgi:formate hydrogenlyase subunit 3/multisubunit Na+/H+ antiporter MnhD subunit